MMERQEGSAGVIMGKPANLKLIKEMVDTSVDIYITILHASLLHCHGNGIGVLVKVKIMK